MGLVSNPHRSLRCGQTKSEEKALKGEERKPGKLFRGQLENTKKESVVSPAGLIAQYV